MSGPCCDAKISEIYSRLTAVSSDYPSIHWAVPAVATIFIGMSFTLVFISFLTYLVEVYLMVRSSQWLTRERVTDLDRSAPQYSASALSGNTVVRSAVGKSDLRATR